MSIDIIHYGPKFTSSSRSGLIIMIKIEDPWMWVRLFSVHPMDLKI